MTAIRTADGKWAVVSGDTTLAGPFDTHTAAWRWIDRYTGDPISRGEQTSEWVFQKMADGGAA